MSSPSHDRPAVPSPLPIVAAPMAGGPTTPELVAAVSAAGGFGFLAAGYLSPTALAEQITSTRVLTDAPFGVNLFVPTAEDAGTDAAVRIYASSLAAEADRLGVDPGRPRWDDDDYEAKLELLTGVHTVSCTFGVPSSEVVARLKAAGTRVAITVTGPDEAERAEAVGADVLIVQGTEAGGHQGGFDPNVQNATPLLAALAAIRARSTLPLVAAGAIMTAADAAAARAAGASAVQIGTALLRADEAGTSRVHRDALSGRYDRTVLTRAFSGRWARGLANRFALEHHDAPGAYPQLHHLTRPLRAAATKAGDPDVPNLWAGTGWRSGRTASAREIVELIADG